MRNMHRSNPYPYGVTEEQMARFSQPPPVKTPFPLWQKIVGMAAPVAMAFFWYRSEGADKGVKRVAKTLGAGFIPFIYLPYVAIDTLKPRK
jgi:hypothetical protein